MRRLIGGRLADGVVEHELAVGDQIRWTAHPPRRHRTVQKPLQTFRSKAAHQLGLEQTHHRPQVFSTGVKAQEVLPDGREIAPGQCFRKAGFQFRLDRCRQRRFGEDVGVGTVFNPMDRLEAIEPLHHQSDAYGASFADLSSSGPGSGGDGQ